jgi:hypothetical protein
VEVSRCPSQADNRIDLGLNDHPYRTQRKAIRALQSDPIAQQADDTPFPSNPSRLPYTPEETILNGTGLRDKILRAFQTDYIPYTPHDTLSEARSAPTIRPDDLDAIPVPTPSLPSENSILSDDQLIQSWTKRHRKAGRAIRIEGDPDIRLNESQMRAMAMMLSERMSLVQGVRESCG